MIAVRAGRRSLSRKLTRAWAVPNRTGATPGVVAVVFEDLAGLLDQVADARGGDLQQVR
jgi:hypothetical protein